MEKKLITFEGLKLICKYNKKASFRVCKKCQEESCLIWQNLESPEEKIIITPAGVK